MAEIATLGISLSNTQAIADAKATGQAMEEMGTKGETAARKIAASSNPVTEAITRQAVTVQQARAAWEASGGDMARFAQELQKVAAATAPVSPALARITDSTRQMTLMQLQAIEMDQRRTASLARLAAASAVVPPAQQRLTDSTRQMTLMQMEAIAINERMGQGANQNRLSLGRLGNQFTSLAGSIAGVHPVAGNLLSVLGNFAIGSVIMTGVLGGIALLAVAYNAITEGARKAKEKSDELTKSLLEQAKAIYQATQAGATNVARAAEQNLENVKRESGVGWRSLLSGRLDPADATAQANRIADAQAAVASAWANVGKIAEDARKTAADKQKTANDKALREEEQFQANVRRARDASIAIDLWQAKERIKAEEEVRDAALKIEKEMADVRIAANKQAEQDALTAATKRAAGEVQITENLIRSMQETWSTFFQGTLTNGLNSFRDLFSGIKALFFKMISDMLAAGVMRRMAGVFGGMGAGTAGGSGSGGMLSGLGAQMAGQAAAGGLAGGFVGYGVGGMVGSAGGGAVAGAATGAAAGFMVGGPLGALAGGLTGLVGGLLGGAKAAREAAEAMRQLKKDYVAAIATFGRDDLTAALAQNAAQAEQLRKMVNEIFAGFWNLLDPDKRAQKQAELDRIAKEEERNAEIIRRQATYAQEDLVVRNLRATGQGGAADQLAFQNQQAREMQAAIDANRDATYLLTLTMTQANELTAFQNGLLSMALRNNPSGFFVEQYLGAAASRGAPPGYPTDGGPTSPPGGGGRPGGRPTHGEPITIILTLDGKVVTRTVVNNLDQTGAATNGAGSSRAQALEAY